jgi:Fe-S-cluster-containing hydrogenase component 2
MHAVRTIRYCTKDCLCLYVCPTGATDTEDGQVDATKCIGCGMCVKSCPSHAISLVPEKFPIQQKHSKDVCDSIFQLISNNVEAENICRQVAENSKDPVEQQFAAAMQMSFRRQSEDMYRECGYMLPQSANTRRLLTLMLSSEDPAFPKEAVEELLALLQKQQA